MSNNDILIENELLKLWIHGTANHAGLHPKARRTFIGLLKEDYVVVDDEVLHKLRWNRNEVLADMKLKPETSYVFGKEPVTDATSSIENMSEDELWAIT